MKKCVNNVPIMSFAIFDNFFKHKIYLKIFLKLFKDIYKLLKIISYCNIINNIFSIWLYKNYLKL